MPVSYMDVMYVPNGVWNGSPHPGYGYSLNTAAATNQNNQITPLIQYNSNSYNFDFNRVRSLPDNYNKLLTQANNLMFHNYPRFRRFILTTEEPSWTDHFKLLTSRLRNMFHTLLKYPLRNP